MRLYGVNFQAVTMQYHQLLAACPTLAQPSLFQKVLENTSKPMCILNKIKSKQLDNSFLFVSQFVHSDPTCREFRSLIKPAFQLSMVSF